MVNTKITPTPEAFAEIKLLKSLSHAELTHLVSLGKAESHEAHSNIVIEGELTWGLYLILEGTLGVYKTNRLTGDNYDVGQLSAGNFFGEMSLIDDNPRSATVRALTHCVLFYIAKESFYKFLDQSSDIKLRFYLSTIKNLVSRLRELDDYYVINQYRLWQNAFNKMEGEK